MFNVTCTRRLEWDMGHRVLNHEGKCARLHGHRYVAEVTCIADQLDGIGRVVDFGVIKELIGGWIDHNWDHRTMLQSGDPIIPALAETLAHEEHMIIVDLNPTAENICGILWSQIIAMLTESGQRQLRLQRLRIWETPNCYAEITRD